jgi:HD superfamily phosphohydrolase
VGNVEIAGDAIVVDPDLRSALGPRVDKVADLLQRKKRLGVEFDILDGPIDSDKLDYLVRDSYYCGVPYGHPDSLRILQSICRIETGAPNEVYLGVTPKGVEAVQYLQFARYQMHRIVYYHKTKRIADAMLVRAAVLAMTTDGTLDPNHFDYRPGDTDFLKLYFGLDDNRLMRRVIEGGKSAGSLMQLVESRNLYKVACDIDTTTLVAVQYQRLEKMSWALLGKLEAEIAGEVGADPSEIIIDFSSVPNPAYRGPSDGLAEMRNVLVLHEPRPKYLYEMPGIWSSDAQFVTHSIGVFCPQRFKDAAGRIAPKVIEQV